MWLWRYEIVVFGVKWAGRLACDPIADRHMNGDAQLQHVCPAAVVRDASKRFSAPNARRQSSIEVAPFSLS
jgi:hypothetical protein